MTIAQTCTDAKKSVIITLPPYASPFQVTSLKRSFEKYKLRAYFQNFTVDFAKYVINKISLDYCVLTKLSKLD